MARPHAALLAHASQRQVRAEAVDRGLPGRHHTILREQVGAAFQALQQRRIAAAMIAIESKAASWLPSTKSRECHIAQTS
jgi:hypothetical protein